MNRQEQHVIKTVSGMMNNEEPISKAELVEKCEEMGWKLTTVNFALSKLKKLNCIKEVGDKMYILENEFEASETPKQNIQKNGYRTKKSRYQGEIPELTDEQSSIKEMVLDNKNTLLGKKIIWKSDKIENVTFPLIIDGAGDVTLRCRLFFQGFMESEEQTGAVIYIPWHEPSITQIDDQLRKLLNIKVEHECFNFAQTIPAK